MRRNSSPRLTAYLALEPHHATRHAIGLRSRTHCGLARNHVNATVLRFDGHHPFACAACVAALEGAGG
ncbi:hypothetical protein BH23ACT2_BH23ACT2_08870 [soil metagenome]